MAKLLYKLGMGTYRRRLPVVLIWLLVLIGTGVGAFTLGGETSNSMSIPGQESTTALERIQEKFGSGETASARVVVQAPDGQKLPQHIKAITDLVADESALKGVRSATNPLDPAAPSVNADVNVGYSTVTYDVKPGEVTDEQRAELTKAVDKARAAGLTVEVTGTAMQETPHVGGPAEAIGVVLALVVLALTYGSLVTAGMNLLSAGIGVGIGTLGITIASGFMDLQSTTPILASMLGLAVGIDYALFIINRFRQELRRGSDVGHAVATAVGTAGSAVVTAGLTVVIALVGLAIAGIPFLTQMGVSAAATIVVSVLIAITLVPAVLSLLGRRVLTRKERAADASEPKDRGVIRAWGGAITRNRVLALLLSVVALGIVAIPVASMDTTLIQKPPAGSTQERADQILAKGFGEGFNGPIIVLFEGEGAAATATEASKPIAQLSDVALVTPAQPSQDGKSALVTVIPKSGPDTVETEKLVADLRAELSGVEGGRAYVTGATAVSVDVATSLDKALPIYLAVVVGLALVLLILVFRSLLVPLVGVLGFLLTIGASLGATVAVFQWGWLAGAVNLDSTGPLISLTPILVIGILFGLAMDYQIFLVSRMHEAHHRGAKPIEAITTGFRQAAPVVVAAALIMFSVFAGFVPAGEATVKSIAFALAVGIFVDAFVVRMVLVPAALALLGERAWWLPKFLRWLPELDVEGTALDEIEKKDKVEPVSVG
ncbi:putative drug exporter of the RND superfamily [Lentzea albidocapillata subsp. violacea]|uniref:Putative drug exporter of the RND superfamily n=1 Tax=Lentzea albidocapillata subsp. violacea TaxID=128104 RepID=A0A1G8V2T9_9PSEU|nr:MMPL family transporter [Lentzea albidocapillata]SDJ59675.1 putative drug exporter of the RND superfamily [Lentzea albidocapillata subsp. violacea]